MSRRQDPDVGGEILSRSSAIIAWHFLQDDGTILIISAGDADTFVEAFLLPSSV